MKRSTTAEGHAPGHAELAEFDPFSREFQQDPFPCYRVMRDASPAFRWPQSDLYFITRYVSRWEDFTLSDENRFEYEASFLLLGLKDLYVDVTPSPR